MAPTDGLFSFCLLFSYLSPWPALILILISCHLPAALVDRNTAAGLDCELDIYVIAFSLESTSHTN